MHNRLSCPLPSLLTADLLNLCSAIVGVRYSFLLCKNRVNACFQDRKIVFDHRPNTIEMNVKVEMDEDISHSINLLPGYFWM